MKTKGQETCIKRLIQNNIQTRIGFNKEKRTVAKEFKTCLPSNIDLLKTYHKLVKRKSIQRSSIIENLLITRPVRSLSGIVNVSVLTKPYPCPGKCIFCPSSKNFPKSYVQGEPAADRAKSLNFSPYMQVYARLKALKAQGHPIDKIELRIIGGTWSFYPKQYQTWFVKKCFQACNEFSKKTKTKNNNLKNLQKENEKSKNRIVGLSIETRPDFINQNEILRLRKLGVTLVEMGVQTVFNDIHKICHTGITAKKIIKATQMLKDSGFKVLYQIMPNLPGSNSKKDLQAFRIIFQNQGFKPDWIKIYPCLVCPNTKLLKIWQENKYQTYNKNQLMDLLISIKTMLPYWVRVTRIFRDIPSKNIISGCKLSNIRELVQAEMKKMGKICRCIRCREVKTRYDKKEKIYLWREDYDASEGKEIFLSFENKERTKLFSLIRLRIPSNTCFIPILQNSSIIREIQTFGRQLPLDKNEEINLGLSPQHKGLGKRLMKEVEKISKKEFNLQKIAVISGVGVRGYYRKLGYHLKNTYMIKKL